MTIIIKYLKEIPRGSKINVEVSDGSKFVIFDNPDGMYSHCTTEKGGVVHLSIMTPVIPQKDGTYRIHDEADISTSEAVEHDK